MMSKGKTKLFWLSCLLVLILGAGWLLGREQEVTHILLNDRVTQAPIPEDIVKSKDCKKYHEWFYSHLTPLAKWDDTCPWDTPPKGEIGEFIINGVKLWVPREYLLIGKNDPDGEQRDLLLSMIYPEMKPDIGKKEEGNFEIVVYISTCSPSMKPPCDYTTISQEFYEDALETKTLTPEEKKLYPKKIRYIPELDLTLYEKKSAYKEPYIRGDRFSPSYWLICDGGTRNENWDPGCYTQYSINNKFYIKHRFRQTDLLKHHDEVKRKVIEKILEWQQDPKKH
jgi:hypothetical protein